MTIGEFIKTCLAIDNESDARAFYDKEVEAAKAHPSSKFTAEEVTKSNIGWCFGEGMTQERVDMWVRVCGAAHPVFGTKLPTPEEAFKMGFEWMREGNMRTYEA